jgi:hypothetical protein
VCVRVVGTNLSAVGDGGDACGGVDDRSDVLDAAGHGIAHHAGPADVDAHPHAQPAEDDPVVDVAPLLGCARVVEQRLGPLRL